MTSNHQRKIGMYLLICLAFLLILTHDEYPTIENSILRILFFTVFIAISLIISDNMVDETQIKLWKLYDKISEQQIKIQELEITLIKLDIEADKLGLFKNVREQYSNRNRIQTELMMAEHELTCALLREKQLDSDV